jgi:hypothetical protein
MSEKMIKIDLKFAKVETPFKGTELLVIPSKYNEIDLCIKPTQNSVNFAIAEIMFHGNSKRSFDKVKDSAISFAQELCDLWNAKYCPLEDAPEDKVFCDYCGEDREKCTCESGNFIPESMCETEVQDV